MLKVLEDEKIILESKLKQINAKISEEEEKLTESITKEVIFKLRDLKEIQNIKGYKFSQYFITFTVGGHDFHLSFPRYDKGWARASLAFQKMVPNEDLFIEMVEFIVIEGHLKIRVLKENLPTVRIATDFKTKEEKTVIDKLLNRYRYLSKYVDTRILDYKTYPIEQNKKCILLMLSKWRESDLSVLLEKGLIVKICKYVWQL